MRSLKDIYFENRARSVRTSAPFIRLTVRHRSQATSVFFADTSTFIKFVAVVIKLENNSRKL